MKFRKKPVVIDAIQFTGKVTHEVEEFLGDDARVERFTDRLTLKIFTLEGEHTVSPGDWIIRGVKGEHYPCKPDIFEATYDAVE